MSVKQDVAIIAVIGTVGSGKSLFINFASGSQLCIGDGLQPCTKGIQVTQPFGLYGQQVVLIDTPGIDGGKKSEMDVLAMINEFLVTNYGNGKKLSGVLYLCSISSPVTGSIRNLDMLMMLCGEDTLKSVIILTTMWMGFMKEINETWEAELATSDFFFKPALDKGANFLRHSAQTMESAHSVLRYLISKKVLVNIPEEAARSIGGQELETMIKLHRGITAVEEGMSSQVWSRMSLTTRPDGQS
ncbi:P-loop containing nucleoside triphosphate hydrolase protein [Infundibulicybe gibba]|nr:P-loop containing nucleoside triphosphate hydrolase protein [Infundibulicybe gibba]